MSTEPSPPLAPRDDPLIIDGISYIPSSALLTGIAKFSFKDDRAFGVLDSRGEAPRLYTKNGGTGSELGIYYNDTRYLSVWELRLGGSSPVPLSQELRYGGSTLVFSMTNKDFACLASGDRVPRDTLLVRRILSFHGDSLFEIVAIRNFDSRSRRIAVEAWAGSRFDDLFEVRGVQRARRGESLTPDAGRQVTTLSYQGLDSRVRSAHILRHFEHQTVELTPTLSGIQAVIDLPAKGDVLLRTAVSFDRAPEGRIKGHHFHDLSVPHLMSLVSEGHHGKLIDSVEIETDNAIVNRAIHAARVDLRMLLTLEDSLTVYPYAGIPWFSAPFGRDGIVTAYQLLPWYPDLARGVLDYVFEHQGKQVDDFTDEQPGKIFHEMRRGEMALTREVPFIPYFGSVDATPLSLILLHEYIRWTLDLTKLREWWPSALRALAWMDSYGDSNGDGFLDYARATSTGLINQGWKDSHDSVMHADGSLAQVPIALCEVQAYAYRARMGMATLARLLGDHALSERLRMQALRMRASFADRYWDAEGGFVALALDRDGAACRVKSSNMGHCLWGEILSDEQARSVARHLASDALFSGHGVRTLADTEIAYNPMSYHNGSVWPHDNSLILEGLRNYGQLDALERITSGMIGVLETSTDSRLPELFCGFRKRGFEPPVPYEVACKPQAWAAGSVFLMLKSMLGLSMDSDLNHLTVRSPLLTDKIRYLEIRGLRGRDWEIDLRFERVRKGQANSTTLDVRPRSGKVRVLQVKG